MEVDNPKSKKAKQEKKSREPLLKENQDSIMMIEAWKHIPKDILEVVLTWLPLVVLFRFRLVCKRWNFIVPTVKFQQRWGEVAPSKQPLFFIKYGGNNGKGSLYDPFRKKWCFARNAILPTLASDLPLLFSGSLICYIDIDHTSFVVGNLLNQVWIRQLCIESTLFKWMLLRGFMAKGIVAVSDISILTSPWTCKIVLLGNNGDFEIFTILKDLTQQSPMITGHIPSHIQMPSNLSPIAVNVGMNLLFLGSKPHGIISYNVVSGMWMQLSIPRPVNSSDLTLIECNGRLLLCGTVHDANATNISVRVWKIESNVMRMWMEIDRMPSSLCLEFEGKIAGFECLCNRNVILIVLRTTRMSRLYTYDVANHEWFKLPKLKLPRSESHTSIVTGIGFFPGFAMP